MTPNRKTMSSRERVIACLEHREPDRVPLSMSITINAYNNLKRHLGIDLPEDLKIGRWTEVNIHPRVAEEFGLDVLGVPMNPSRRSFPRQPGANRRIDEWGVEWAKVELPKGGYYYEMAVAPLANATVADLDDYPWPDGRDPGRVEGLAETFRRIHNDTEFAILSKFGGAVFEQAWYLRGMERFFTDMVENPAFVHALLDKICTIQMAWDAAGIEAVGEYVDILRLSGEDLGTQEAPLISLRMFRQYVRPYLERLWTFAKGKLLEKNPRGKIMLHSCGAVRTFIPEWIAMGLDILDPIQPSAKGMEPERLKADFGAALTFHGGIDAQYVLPFGTPEEVRQHTCRYIQALAPGGGYIVAPVHNVQGDVPPENLVAMRDAVEEFGYYPIAERST
jgi:uroporphyrinogen decarboxylase